MRAILPTRNLSLLGTSRELLYPQYGLNTITKATSAIKTMQDMTSLIFTDITTYITSKIP